MNKFIRLTEIACRISQAGTPRHDKCVRLPVSCVTIITIDYVVKTKITNKKLFSQKTYENTYTKRNAKMQTPNQLKL